MNKKTIEALVTLILVALVIIFEAAIIFWCGYFTGWLAKITIGDKLIEGLNLIFHTNYFEKEMLPMMAGVIAWVGSFFKDSHMLKGIIDKKDKK